MKPFQKIIKYCAMAFALYLSIMIIAMIVFGITAIFGISAGIDAWESNVNTQQTLVEYQIQEYSNIENIDINLKICRLEIKEGDTLKVETSDITDKFESKVEGKTLKIKDKRLNVNWFDQSEINPKVVIYMPNSIEFKKFNIEMGVNETKIDYMKADKLDMKLGVGKTNIENMLVNTAKIEGGAGETIISDSTIDDLELDAGIGSFVITTDINKRADISSGVGKLELNLKNNKQEYAIKAKTGLGRFLIDGVQIDDNQKIGTGDIGIKVDAGLGETRINFKEYAYNM